MNSIKRLIPSIILLFAVFFGCDDDFMPGSTVNVHLSDIVGADYPSSYYFFEDYLPTVSIGSYPISLTDRNGNCSFSNVSYPYNLIVQNGFGNYLFKNVSVASAKVVCNGTYDYQHHYQSCNFMINMQMPAENQIAMVHFISNDKFDESQYRIIYYGHISGLFRLILIPPGVNSISGKLLLFYCSGYYRYNEEDEIVFEPYTFDSMAVKNITINSGDNDTVKFSNNDMISMPPASNISYSSFSNYSTPYTEAYFTFPGYSKSSDFLFYRQKYPNASIPIVTSMPLDFEIKLRSVLVSPNENSQSFISVKAKAGDNVTLQHKHINFIEPKDMQTGINENTIFRYEDDAEAGVYAITLNGEQYIFTDKKQIKFGELISRVYTPRPGSLNSVKIYKYSSFNDINDFLMTPFTFNQRFNRISESEKRYFRIAE